MPLAILIVVVSFVRSLLRMCSTSVFKVDDVTDEKGDPSPRNFPKRFGRHCTFELVLGERVQSGHLFDLFPKDFLTILMGSW